MQRVISNRPYLLYFKAFSNISQATTDTLFIFKQRNSVPRSFPIAFFLAFFCFLYQKTSFLIGYYKHILVQHILCIQNIRSLLEQNTGVHFRQPHAVLFNF